MKGLQGHWDGARDYGRREGSSYIIRTRALVLAIQLHRQSHIKRRIFRTELRQPSSSLQSAHPEGHIS